MEKEKGAILNLARELKIRLEGLSLTIKDFLMIFKKIKEIDPNKILIKKLKNKESISKDIIIKLYKLIKKLVDLNIKVGSVLKIKKRFEIEKNEFLQNNDNVIINEITLSDNIDIIVEIKDIDTGYVYKINLECLLDISKPVGNSND
jgi:hypothetical protein